MLFHMKEILFQQQRKKQEQANSTMSSILECSKVSTNFRALTQKKLEATKHS